MNERLCANWYKGGKRKSFFYYRSSGRKRISWLEESTEGSLESFLVLDTERVKKTDVEIVKAFVGRNPGAKVHVYAPISERLRISDIVVDPWECL